MKLTKNNIIFPKHISLSKKEEQEISEKINGIGEGMAKSLFNGLFFFITVPIQIYTRIKAWRKRK